MINTDNLTDICVAKNWCQYLPLVGRVSVSFSFFWIPGDQSDSTDIESMHLLNTFPKPTLQSNHMNYFLRAICF